MSLPSSTSSEADPDRRTRIIKHINASHRPELSRYLRHFAQVHSASAIPSSCSLVDVSLSCMVISASDSQEHTIPFDPPLESWADIRPRVVEMDAKARRALNEEHDASSPATRLTTYAAPSGHGAVVFGSVLFYFFCRATLHLVVPGSRAYDMIDEFWPGGVEWYAWVVKAIFWPTVLLHTGEAVIFDKVRMERYGVTRGSKVWWKWMVNVWIEGITTFGRAERCFERQKKAH